MKRRVKSLIWQYRIAIEDNWNMGRYDISKALLTGLLAIPVAIVAAMGICVAMIAVIMALGIVVVALGLVLVLLSVVLVLVPPVVLVTMILASFYYGVRLLAGHLPGRKRLQ